MMDEETTVTSEVNNFIIPQRKKQKTRKDGQGPAQEENEEEKRPWVTNEDGGKRNVVSRFLFTKPDWLCGRGESRGGSRCEASRGPREEDKKGPQAPGAISEKRSLLDSGRDEREASSFQTTPIEKDEDGDLELPRRRGKVEEGLISIEHRMSTSIPDVGLQVWRGGLFLADYVLDNPGLFEGRTILELGCGTGVASIAASMASPLVVAATDYSERMVELARRNFERNCIEGKALFATLDLTQSLPKELGSEEKREGKAFVHIKDVDVVMGGDIVYDSRVTDGLLWMIFQFLDREEFRNSERLFLFSIEKRYVFTQEDLDTVAPAYDRFCEGLREMLKLPSNATLEEQTVLYAGKVKVQVSELDSSRVTQYFCYEASPEMRLIKIEVKSLK